jgi:hypothetical protein
VAALAGLLSAPASQPRPARRHPSATP